jgi:hypothetical protein
VGCQSNLETHSKNWYLFRVNQTTTIETMETLELWQNIRARDLIPAPNPTPIQNKENRWDLLIKGHNWLIFYSSFKKTSRSNRVSRGFQCYSHKILHAMLSPSFKDVLYMHISFDVFKLCFLSTLFKEVAQICNIHLPRRIWLQMRFPNMSGHKIFTPGNAVST